MSNPSDWACDANEALEIGLASINGDSINIDTFKPEMSYAIFGTEQLIYGYKKLSIKMHYVSGSLRMYLGVDYKAQLETAKLKADNIEETLYKFIPTDYTKSIEEFNERVKTDSKEFKPLGERIKSWKGEGDDEDSEYELYRATLTTPGFKDYHRRMQTFLLFFIEGASYIDEEDDRWEIVTLYKRDIEGSYHFMGYSTMYPFFAYPDKIRMRISQFLLLPPYQGGGFGSKLYTSIYDTLLAEDKVVEVTVEDPNESFDDMRDRSDLKRMFDDCVFNDIKLPLTKEWLTKTRKKYKMAPRQFIRCVEMGLLWKLDRTDEVEYRAYRLYVKRRLYQMNEEALKEIQDKQERIDKLDSVYRLNENYYLTMIEKVST